MPLRFEGGSSPIGANVLLIIFLVLSLVCTTVYSSESEDGPLHTIQNGFSSLSAPFQFIGAGISAAGNSASTGVEDLSADANTLSQLKQQNEELRNYVSQLEEYRQEAQRLEQLQKLSDSYNMDSVTCHVVGKSNDAWSRTITLDQGSDSGVEPGMPVCGACRELFE